MIPTVRLLLLLLLAVVPLAAAGTWPAAGALASLYVVMVLGAAGVDYLLGPGRERLAVERIRDDCLYIGTDNTVEISLANRSTRALGVRVRDEYPPEFRADAAFLAGRVPSGQTLRLPYTVRPPARGRYHFGDVVLRVEGALGLLTRQHRCPAQGEVKVYPNLGGIRRYELLKRRGMAAEAGLRRARLFGGGTEFEALREYLPDDDYRRIHWKASARRNLPMTVEYEAERSQNVMVLLDIGRLMGARVDELTKLDHAINCAVTLAQVAVLRGDRLGLLCFADRVETYLPPKRGRRHLFHLVEAVYALRPQPVEANLGLALAYLSARTSRRSLWLVLTDVGDLEPAREAAKHLRLAARHHLIAHVSIVDPSLVAVAEGEVRGAREAYAAAVAQRLLNERRERQEVLSRSGVVAMDLPAEQLSPAVVDRYLEIKARGRL